MSTVIEPGLPDWMADQRGVFNFSSAMLEKLHDKRREGRSGWNDPGRCSVRQLKKMLSEHLKKGDMVDVANFAMMIWNRQQMEKRRDPGL